jgi:hypothetical protein
MTTKPVAFSQSSVDPYFDGPSKARNIGKLTLDKTRLTVFTALTRNDKVDYFRFDVTSKLDNVTLGQRGNADVRVQILDKTGRTVIADNSTQANAAQQKAYKDAQSGRLALDKGTYLIKVERAAGQLNTVNPSYVIQLYAGKYNQDYDTRESAPRVQDAIPSSTTTTLFDTLTAKSSKSNPLGLNIFNYFA